ncbi:MAG TPA: ABC transporter ATP-binding protein, partial [Globicatella sulfidifaciens]|nr:ABC transporter ATP-binding protein [Globicatella sulfidifaciens]
MAKEQPQSEKALKRALRYADGYLVPIVIALIFSIISSVITVIGPDKMSEMMDVITQGVMVGIDLNKIDKIGKTLVILYLTAAVMGYAQSFIVATISQRYTQRLRREIAEKMNRLPLRYFDSRPTGDVLSIITNDLDTVGQSLNQSLGTLVSATVLLIGTLFMMFKTNWVMALTAISSVFIGFIGMVFIMSKSRAHFKAQQKNLATVNGYIEEAYTGLSIVSSYNAADEMKGQFAKLNEQLYGSAWKSQFLGGMMMPLM